VAIKQPAGAAMRSSLFTQECHSKRSGQ